LVFKNAFKRKLLQGRWKPVEETFKNEIKAKLIEYIQHFKEIPSLLKNIQSSILDIAEIDFPTYYKSLLLYIRNGYEVLSTQIETNPMSLIENQHIKFFKEVKSIFKRKRQTKGMPKMNETHFRESFEMILQSCFSIMSLVLNNFNNVISSQNPENSIPFLTLSQLNDEIILMLLQYIHGDANLEDIFKTIIEQMFQKCSLLVQILTKEPKNLPSDIKKLLNKNLIGILYNFSIIQYNLPFMFHGFLNQYLELIKFILDNNYTFSDEKILKSGLICLFKLFKTFAYFADSLNFGKSLGKHDQNLSEKVQRQINVSQSLNSLFTEQRIEIFIFSFLQNILIREFNKQKDEDNFENLIELGLIIHKTKKIKCFF